MSQQRIEKARELIARLESKGIRSKVIDDAKTKLRMLDILYA